MGLFNFGKSKQATKSTEIQTLHFGRYTDRNKNKIQHDHWDASVKLFGQKEYFRAIEELLYYIRDEKQNNVVITKTPDKIEFSIIQGSKTFHGKAENGIIEASGRIALFTVAPVPVMRKLLTLNYMLRYTWCGIQDNALGIYFQSPFENASSWKIYSALRELALNIDKQDDLLTEEFDTLEEVDTIENLALPENIKEVKYSYLNKWINDTLSVVRQSDQQKYSGLNSYRLLALCLRIDYLLTPQGTLMDALEKIINMYFKRPQGNNDINTPIAKEFDKILALPKESVMNSFYQVKSTFSLVSPSTYKQVADFVFEESKSKDYYLNNKEPQHVSTIYEYITGYNCFYFGMTTPLIDLNHLYYRVLHSDFFSDLTHAEPLYDSAKGVLHKSQIIRNIDDIVKKHRTQFPGFVFNHSKLKWNSLTDFTISYFQEFDFLKLPS